MESTFSYAHEPESSIADLGTQIASLERRLAELSANREDEDSGEWLVRKVRQTEILADLSEKRAELNQLLRRALRESSTKIPVVSADGGSCHSAQGLQEPISSADECSDTGTAACPAPESSTWMRARHSYEVRAPSGNRLRRLLMTALGTGT